jgi:hypothetical protein
VRRASKYWPMSTEDLSKLNTLEQREEEGDDAIGLEIFGDEEVDGVVDGGELEEKAEEAEKTSSTPSAGKRVLQQLGAAQQQPQLQVTEEEREKAFARAEANAAAEKKAAGVNRDPGADG